MPYAVGLDGQRIKLRPRRHVRVVAPAQRGDASGMSLFDTLPPWARDALNGERLSFKIKTQEVAPYIRMGALNSNNLGSQLAENDKRLRRAHGGDNGGA